MLLALKGRHRHRRRHRNRTGHRNSLGARWLPRRDLRSPARTACGNRRSDRRAAGGAASPSPATSGSPTKSIALIDQVMDATGRVDVFVNNAGGQFVARAEDIQPQRVSGSSPTDGRRRMVISHTAWPTALSSPNALDRGVHRLQPAPRYARRCPRIVSPSSARESWHRAWPWSGPSTASAVNCVSVGTIATEGLEQYEADASPNGRRRFPWAPRDTGRGGQASSRSSRQMPPAT